MNKDTFPNKIRKLTKAQLLQSLEGEKYVKRMLEKLGIPGQGYLGKLLVKAFEDNGIDITHLPHGRRENLLGKTFGRLTVIRMGDTLKCGNTTWICSETETGIEKPVLSKHLLGGKTKSFSYGHKKGKNHGQWTGHEKISGSFWSNLKHHALYRKLKFDIDIKFAWELYLKQNRKCALSDVDIYFGESNQCPYTASLDRIDSTKGYTRDNVQWVHTKINIMKNKFSQEEFIDFCKKVSNVQANKN